MPVTQDDSRPGNRAVKNIGFEHPAKRPSLQMRDLNVMVQHNSPPRLAKPGAKLDILDGGPAIAFVESTHGQEQFASNSAAASPERRGLTARLLVYKVVRQVLVLGDEILF